MFTRYTKFLYWHKSEIFVCANIVIFSEFYIAWREALLYLSREWTSRHTIYSYIYVCILRIFSKLLAVCIIFRIEVASQTTFSLVRIFKSNSKSSAASHIYTYFNLFIYSYIILRNLPLATSVFPFFFPASCSQSILRPWVWAYYLTGLTFISAGNVQRIEDNQLYLNSSQEYCQLGLIAA